MSLVGFKYSSVDRNCDSDCYVYCIAVKLSLPDFHTLWTVLSKTFAAGAVSVYTRLEFYEIVQEQTHSALKETLFESNIHWLAIGDTFLRWWVKSHLSNYESCQVLKPLQLAFLTATRLQDADAILYFYSGKKQFISYYR